MCPGHFEIPAVRLKHSVLSLRTESKVKHLLQPSTLPWGDGVTLLLEGEMEETFNGIQLACCCRTGLMSTNGFLKP